MQLKRGCGGACFSYICNIGIDDFPWVNRCRAVVAGLGVDMSANITRSTLLHDGPDLDASEDEVADFIEAMLNELSLLAAGRLISRQAQERIGEKIELFETYFVRKAPRLLC
jgi:hypothetical protein